MAKARQVKDQEAHHYRILHVDEAEGNAWRDKRARQPATPLVMLVRYVILGDPRQNRKRDQRRHYLHDGGALKGAEPLSHYRPSRNSSPNAAAQVAERL